jgi:hypothetical protein
MKEMEMPIAFEELLKDIEIKMLHLPMF